MSLTRPQRKFNKKFSRKRIHVERAFGILKARLLKRLDNQIKNVSTVVITCCVLHSICQMNRDEYIDDDGILDEVLRQGREVRKRRIQNHYENHHCVTVRLCLTNFVNN